jgi:autoinducer 2-degrading protein
MHIVLVQMTVKPEHLAEFEQVLLHNARESVAKDPGCLRFDVSQATEDPLTWVIHEVYDREEAHAAHRQSAHFAAFSTVAATAVTDRRVVKCTGRHIT